MITLCDPLCLQPGLALQMMSWVRSLDVSHLVCISSCTYDVLLCNKAATLCTRTPEATQKLSFHTTIPEPKRWTVDQETPTRQHGIQQKCTEWDAGWDVGLPNIARILGVYSS
jgi:hypothetical protein